MYNYPKKLYAPIGGIGVGSIGVSHVASTQTVAAVLGFLPSDISDLAFWFRYDKGVTLDGSLVDTWQDTTGTYYAKAADGGGDRPTFNTTHITFDGTTDSLEFFESDGTTANPKTLNTDVGGWTVIGIYTDDDWDDANTAIVGDANSNQHFFRHSSAAGGSKFTVKASNQTRHLALDSSLTDSRYYSIMMTCSAAGELLLYIDNTVQSTGVEFSDDTKDLQIEAIGERNNTDLLGGHVKHVLAYDRILTATERGQIQSWANAFIG